MKRIYFVTKSKLAQNLMDIIIKSINKKIDYKTLNFLSDLKSTPAAKPVQLLIVDHNAVENHPETLDLIDSKQFSKSKKIFVHSRSVKINRDRLEQLGFTHFLTKPFLPEEFIELIHSSLGGKS